MNDISNRTGQVLAARLRATGLWGVLLWAAAGPAAPGPAEAVRPEDGGPVDHRLPATGVYMTAKTAGSSRALRLADQVVEAGAERRILGAHFAPPLTIPGLEAERIEGAEADVGEAQGLARGVQRLIEGDQVLAGASELPGRRAEAGMPVGPDRRRPQLDLLDHAD